MILAVLLLMNVPFFLTGYAAKSLTENIILREKEEKLLALARVLDMRLGPGGFAAIIEQAGAEGAPREDKIKILNEALRESTDEVGSSAPGLGVGFYCR